MHVGAAESWLGLSVARCLWYDDTMKDPVNTSLRDFPPASDLDSYLAAVARDDCYRVIRPLGAAARAAQGSGASSADVGTVTELVQFEGANGAALGPFVRKRIDLSLGIGAAYEELFSAQQAGARFVHLPRMVECFKTGREFVVVSEYVPGETLEEYVHRVGPGVETALRVVPAVCAAVSELHRAFDPPIVHRDLKPSNVIIASSETDGSSKGIQTTLIDLGIARRYRQDAAADTVRFGTRAYAPPEQYGFGQTSVRSDVYALGMIAFFCCTGVEPAGQPTADGLTAVGVPAACAGAILRATAFDPAQRYESAGSFSVAFAGHVGAQAPAGSHAPAGSVQVDAAAGSAQTDTAVNDAREAASDAGRSASGSAEDSATGSTGELRPTPAVDSAFDAQRTAGDAQWIATRRPSSAHKLPVFLGFAKRFVEFAHRHHTITAGHVWNVALTLVAVLFVIVATQQVGAPIGGKTYPLWYALYLTYGLSLPLVLGVMYLMADRKSLLRFAPRLASRSRLHDARSLAIYLAIAFAVGVIANALI